MFKRLLLTGLAAIGAAVKKSENGSFDDKTIAPSSFEMPESEYHIETMALSKHQVELDTSATDLNFEKTNKEVKSWWQSIVDFVSNLPTTMYKTIFPEKAKAQEIAEAKAEEAAKTKKAKAILESNFKDRAFDYAEFAKINGIYVDPNFMPHSDIVKNSFSRMHKVVNDLMTDGIIVNKDFFFHPKIQLTSDEIIDIYNSIESFDLDEETMESSYVSSKTNIEQLKAYQLYSKLGYLIQNKISDVVKDEYFTKNKIYFVKWGTISSNLAQSILSLPLPSVPDGLEMCQNIVQPALKGKYSVLTLLESTLSDNQKKDSEYQAVIKQLHGFGTFAPFGNLELAQEVLKSEQFAASMGMQPSWCIVDATGEGAGIYGFSDPLAGVLMHDNLMSAPKYHGFTWSHHTFYHETTHNVRQVVGAIHGDKSIARQGLSDILKDHSSIISSIKLQISNYSLTNYEEYLAEFDSLVLCALEEGKNPFDYIKDERLWKLYYEFGGPDHAWKINEITTAKFGHDILTNPKFDMISGYPSKFGIDINQIKDQQVVVEGLVAIGKKSNVTINEETILPPPPLGYCYEVKDNKLKLKDLASKTYYDPTFCSLTNGPLTLMKTSPDLVHHFELLPKESSGVLDTFKSKLSESQQKKSSGTVFNWFKGSLPKTNK